MDGRRLSGLPGVARLACALFVLWILLFQVVAQANLWVQDGGGSLPGPTAVLEKYAGKPGATKLHKVLDPALPESDPHAMWPFLGDGPAEQAAARAMIFSWVDAGAPRERWGEVAPIFTGSMTCGQCHTPGGAKADLPFDTWEAVLPVTQPDRGMPWPALLVSAHNHLYAFSVLALLLSMGAAFSPALGRARVLLVLGAFVGAAIDVLSWFLTKTYGSPFHLGVVAGGALFGGCVVAMGLLVLDEVVLRGRVARRVARVLRLAPDGA
jgi:hypothetical protein